MQAPKKEKKDEDEDDLAYKKKKQEEAAALKAAKDKGTLRHVDQVTIILLVLFILSSFKGYVNLRCIHRRKIISN